MRRLLHDSHTASTIVARRVASNHLRERAQFHLLSDGRVKHSLTYIWFVYDQGLHFHAQDFRCEKLTLRNKSQEKGRQKFNTFGGGLSVPSKSSTSET